MEVNWVRLVHERLATIATFAYSQIPLAQLRRAKFTGQWPSLETFLHELPKVEANKALMELALYFRTLDDRENLTDYWKATDVPSVGVLYLRDGSTEPLSPREMSNKVIHAESVEWQFFSDQMIICTAGANAHENWLRAEIMLVKLIAVGGQLQS